jgi:hypothetical protein
MSTIQNKLVWLFALLVGFYFSVFFGHSMYLEVYESHPRTIDHVVAAVRHEERREILALYVYSDTDPAYRGNLEVFIRNGVHTDDSADYIVVVQVMDLAVADAVLADLPELPPYARYKAHVNSCYDW